MNNLHLYRLKRYHPNREVFFSSNLLQSSFTKVLFKCFVAFPLIIMVQWKKWVYSQLRKLIIYISLISQYFSAIFHF